jgi:hypothetical protein
LNSDCKNLIKIDSSEYVKNEISYEKFDQISELKKINGEIKIPIQNKTFKDSLSDENYIEYTVIGKFKNWNLIKGQNYNQNYYYLISENQIDSLVGKPKIFENKILSIEDEYTDFPEIIEIWNISEKGNLNREKTFSLKFCKDAPIYESYLSGNNLYIKTGYETGKHEFCKMNIQ